MHSKRRISKIISITAIVLVVICVGLVLVETQTRIVRRWVDDVLYDNRYHYLSCEQLPSISEVERVIQEHQDVIQQIEAVYPGLVGVEVSTLTTKFLYIEQEN